MTPIETRLAGRDASLSGIRSAIHQQLLQAPLARVELRYSTQARQPLLPQKAKEAIANLLRENGLGNAAVSVRAHEGPIDDATGEHLLRLYPAERALAAQPRPARGWRAWLARWFPGWFAVPAVAPRQEPGLTRTPAAIAAAEAVAKLRQAVRKGASQVEVDNAALMLDGQAAQVVRRARITVRLEPLHRVLDPLLRKDSAAVAGMVKSAGLVVDAGFTLDYRFQPGQPGDGTGFANESDVEVELLLGTSTPVPTAMPDTAVPDTAMPTPPEPAGTAMPPAGTVHTLAPTVALTVRVLGTLQGRFAQAFELQFDQLPARFDRSALERAGFARAQPGLLAVASNSCPLVIQPGPDGQLVVQASTRAAAAGAELPMYFHRDTLQGLCGTLPLPPDGTQLVVNAPGGVCDPATGRLLPALVIELLPAPGASPQSQLPWAA